MITPPLFYAICVAVAALVGWLYFSRQDLKRSLNEAGNDVARLKGENTRVNGEVERLTAENETLRTEKEEANARVAGRDLGYAALQAEKDRAIARTKKLDKSAVEDSKQIVALRQELKDVTALNIKLQLKLAGFEQTAAALKEADARRPELTIRPKFLEGGVRLGLVDQDGKALMVSPSSYLDLDRARGVMDTIATARVHRGRGVRK